MTPPNDQQWMDLALQQAGKGVGRTAPNPPVGAVIVRDGTLLGQGYHQAAGRPHAEREALADALSKHGPDALRGATAYVTLEPCSTHGRTPPCTQGLIDAGIRRVVYAAVDRNPAHHGRADALLRAAGIEVLSGVGNIAAEALLRPFFKVRETGLPWVIWKTAMSLDARLTRPPGEGQWLTSATTRHDVQHLRSQVDAILTSGETVRRDRPALTIRVPEFLTGRTQPWRVVFSNHPETLPRDAPLFVDEWRGRTLLERGNDLTESLRRIVRDQGVLSAMVEAGGKFSATLMAAKLIDEVVIYLAPRLCGGPTTALAMEKVMPPVHLDEISFTRLDQDVRLRGVIRRPAA